MTTTLRDALVDAAGPVTVVPPEHEIARRSRRLRRNSWLLEAGAVMAVALVFLAVVVLPDNGAPTVRTIGPAQQQEQDAAEGGRAPDGAGATTTTTASTGTLVRGVASSIPAVTVTVPGAPAPPPPPGFVGPPPSGARLAFTYGTAIETMRPDGSDRRLLYDDGTFYALAGWSPKRDRLAVLAWGQENRRLATLDVETGAFRTVVDREGVNVESADWSPDGKWLVYSARTTTGGTDPSTWHNVGLVRPDGSENHQLPVRACGPVWAPDSKQIAVVSCGGSGAQLDMAIVEADGSGVTTLSGVHMMRVSWSPDGKWLAGSRFREAFVGEDEAQPLVVFRPDGSDLRTLPSGSAQAYRPAWTTDSARLIYANDAQTTFDGPCGVPTAPPCDPRTFGLYSIAFDGSDEFRLTPDSFSQPVMPWR